MPAPLLLVHPDVEEQQFCSELLPGDRAPDPVFRLRSSHPISKGATHQPVEGTLFGRLYPGSGPFGHGL